MTEHEHYWDTPEWRADMIRVLVSDGGLSVAQADRVVERLLKRYRKESEGDAA